MARREREQGGLRAGIRMECHYESNSIPLEIYDF